MTERTNNGEAVHKWAEDWIMDNLEEGRESTKQEWLKMLRSGNLLQCDKITSFMVNLQDEELKKESTTAFEVGLVAAGVSKKQVKYIMKNLFV